MNSSAKKKFAVFKAQGLLPSPRGVALQIIQRVKSDACTTQEIAALISRDPVLSARIVKMARLLATGERIEALSMTDVLSVQGVKSVGQLALLLSLIDDFRSGVCPLFDYQKFWMHALCTGLAAQAMVEKKHAGVADEAFLLGLLSQIGRLALSTLFVQAYSHVLEKVTHPGELVSLEQNAFGIDHNQLSALMLADWGFSEQFQQIALHIEQPAACGFSDGDRDWRLLHLFHLSDRIASVCMSTPFGRYRLIPQLMLLATRAGVESAALVEVGDAVIRGMSAWGELLKIDIPELPSFESILNSASHSGATAGVDSLAGTHVSSFKLRILLVDDDSITLLLYKTILEQSGHTVMTAANGREALESVKHHSPQLIISDWVMPEMDGVEFCRELRKNADWHKIYVFIVTVQDSAEKLIEAFEAGANDYLTKPINSKVLTARLRSAQRIIQMQEAQEVDRLQLRQFADELAESNRRLQSLALTDVLTGLPNRRYAMERLEQEWALATRAGRSFSCMIVDIDHFKSVNDTYGHQTGDEVLNRVASCLQQAARKQDVVCRVGGEEFMVICPDSDVAAAYTYAERLRQQVSAQTLTVSGHALRLTVSVGLTDNAQMGTIDAMLHEADTRLYAAKAAGRNCTVSCSQIKLINAD